MGLGWIRFPAVAVAAAAAATLGLGALTAHADDSSSWQQERRTRFAAYSAAHPSPEAEIAAIKARTATMIAGYLPPQGDAMLDRAPVIWRVSEAPVELWDGPEYPELVVVPAGEYTMGSPASEPDRLPNE